MDFSSDYRCSHTDFQDKADIPNTHIGIPLVERLNLLQRIKVAFHISHVCFLWHDWLVSKISHLDFLSVFHAHASKKIIYRKHITKGRMIQTFSRALEKASRETRPNERWGTNKVETCFSALNLNGLPFSWLIHTIILAVEQLLSIFPLLTILQ